MAEVPRALCLGLAYLVFTVLRIGLYRKLFVLLCVQLVSEMWRSPHFYRVFHGLRTVKFLCEHVFHNFDVVISHLTGNRLFTILPCNIF